MAATAATQVEVEVEVVQLAVPPTLVQAAKAAMATSKL
jgi:hypothetical protein